MIFATTDLERCHGKPVCGGPLLLHGGIRMISTATGGSRAPAPASKIEPEPRADPQDQQI